MASAPPKEYGLITRKKPTGGSIAAALPVTAFSQASRLAAFASDSDDDDPSGAAAAAAKSSSGASKVNLSLGALQQRQIQKAQQSALADDPTIYQYDELYDDLQAKRDTVKQAQRAGAATGDPQQPKRPKYIERLLVTAESRKKEYERRIERQVQKERDAEGAEFADKESFVTASYRAKLEEMRAAEAAAARDEYLEAIGDVTKQRDLGGFYRHLYEQRMGDGDETAAAASAAKPDVSAAMVTKVPNKERKYRQRKTSAADGADGEDGVDDDEDDGAAGAKKSEQHIQSNLDADSDFSIDSSDSEAEENVDKDADKKKAKKNPSEKETANVAGKSTAVDESGAAVTTPLVEPTAPTSADTTTAEASAAAEAARSATPPPPPAPKPVKIKVNIWLKRTVGDTLLAAIERYHDRKRARLEETN